jgi:hypothetical protein
MSWEKKLIVLAACGIFALPAYANETGARHRVHHPHYMRQANCVYRNAAGNLITCDGWRKRDTARGWDHSCMNLPYLPSQFACTPR